MYKQLIRVVPVLLVGSACLLGNDSHAQAGNPSGAPTDNSATPPPKKGFFSSLGDSLKQAIDPKAVRGYFDVGAQRYYCLVDTKTGANQANAVQGQLVASGNGQMTITQPTQSLQSCDQAEANGKLVMNPGAPSAGPSAKFSGADASKGAATLHASSHTRSDAANWDVLGVKLGSTAQEADQAIRVKFPKSAKLDTKNNIRTGQFSAGLKVISGASFVDGQADIFGMATKQQLKGGDAMGLEKETVRLHYVWPSDGQVVLISRQHDYVRRPGTPLEGSGLPTIGAIHDQLVSKFGEPDVERWVKRGSDRPHSEQGGYALRFGLDSTPGVTWIWSADANVDLHKQAVWERCMVKVTDLVTSMTNGQLQPITRPECGKMLIVFITAERSDDFPSNLTQMLYDDDAYQRAMRDLSAALQQQETTDKQKAEVAGNNAKPVL